METGNVTVNRVPPFSPSDTVRLPGAAGTVSPVKPFKNPCFFFVRNAWPVIRYMETEGTVFGFCLQKDRTSGRRIRKGIFNQDRQKLEDTLTVTPYSGQILFWREDR